MKTIPRSITIVPVLNGFIVEVGCQRLVFPDAKTLSIELERYYRNPAAVEKHFLDCKINDTMEERNPLLRRLDENMVSSSPICEPCPPPSQCERQRQ